MLMKKYILLFFISPLLSAYAQTNVSLQQAKTSAIANKSKIQTDKAAQEVARAQIQEALTKYNPQVNATADIRYNLPDPVKLGAVLNPQIGADASYAILDKKIKYDVKQAELNYELSKFTEEIDAEDLVNNVVKSYINVLTNKERLKQLQVALKRLQDDQKEIDSKVKNGLIQNIEGKRVATNIANAQSQIEQQKEAILIAEKVLIFNAGMNLDTEIALTDNLETLQAAFKSYAGSIKAPDFSTTPFFRQQRMQQQLSENQIAKLKAKMYPTISLYGYLGTIGLINDESQVFTRWYPISYLGVRVNWNINPLWENKHFLPQNQLKIKQIESGLKEWEEGQSIQIDQAESSAKRNLEDIEIQERNVTFAEENLKFLHSRFASDLITYKEVADADADLETAKINLLIAKYNYLTSLTEIQKARGEMK
jgi:outer membrane protein